eukprot:CAMPEP_0202713168 /NCGR_PEP_ID=MMETSP1385-20130828/50819_1 /ASSEMBLY_ACC=CAM_ASM_000861 /TAXON_ID=933848 /ORGANISM="Elphidium margaritaceum" /LENGTH=388 /DNA_ID=CAMNT_0049373433 /DNA_START=35 /DNA_END=1201 /DNA_ORIENTATION=+
MSWFTNTNTNTNTNTGWGVGGNNVQQQRQQQQQQQQRPTQFVTRDTRFSALQDDKKQMFIAFERQVIESTNVKRDELSVTVKKLEQLPDIGQSLKSYHHATSLLKDKLASYRHELDPFTQKLKKEYVYACQVQVDTQRGSSLHSQQLQHLPPPFYWDKVNEFQEQLTELRKQLETLQQHLSDISNSEHNGADMINGKSVANALHASHRSTLNIAAQVIANHNMVERLKQQYKQFRLQQFGDSHDPFQDRTLQAHSTVPKIEQYVNKGLEMKGLDIIDTNGGNLQQSQSQGWNNNSNNNKSAFGLSFGGATTTNNTNTNNTNMNNTNVNNNTTSSGFNWGSTGNNNANNTSTGTGFNWGSSNAGNTGNTGGNNSWTSNSYQFRSNSFAK